MPGPPCGGGWMEKPGPEDPQPCSRNCLLSQSGQQWEMNEKSRTKMMQILQKLRQGLQHRASACPTPPTFPRLGFGRCGAEPPQDLLLPSEPVGATKAGLGPVRGHGGRAGLEGISKLLLFQPPSTTPCCSKATIPERFLIPCWFPHALSFWFRKCPFPGWKPPSGWDLATWWPQNPP